MATAESKTYEDYLREVDGIGNEQLREMTADWRLPNKDAPLNFKEWGEPSEAEIKYFERM
jgi:hypothetical protein